MSLQNDFDKLKKHATYSHEAMDQAERFIRAVDLDDSPNLDKVKTQVMEMLKEAKRKLGYFGAHP